MHSSTIGKVRDTLGGVGRNLAEAIHRLGVSTLLISAVAEDLFGKKILEQHAAIGMCNDGIRVVAAPDHADVSTATFNCIIDEQGDLVAGSGGVVAFVVIPHSCCIGYSAWSFPN